MQDDAAPFEKVRFEVKGRLAHITLNNPPDNLLSLQLLGELSELMESAVGQTETAALLLTASGPSFCGGLDYAEHSREMVFSALERFRNIGEFLFNLDYPTVALVDGRVRNWGCDLLHFFDLVLASSAATFQYDNLAFGTFPPVGAILMGQTPGFAAALQTFLGGEEFPAARALELGLVSRVHPREELVAELKKTLAHLSTRSAPVTGLLLRNLRRSKHDAFQRFIDEAYTDYLNILTDYEDFGEGIAAWAERRPPSWKNR
jgi:methylglutaconyl-CoA hydratase